MPSTTQLESPVGVLTLLAEDGTLTGLYMERQRLTLPATTATLKTKPPMTTEEALDAIVSEEATAASDAVLGHIGVDRSLKNFLLTIANALGKLLRIIERFDFQFPCRSGSFHFSDLNVFLIPLPM